MILKIIMAAKNSKGQNNIHHGPSKLFDVQNVESPLNIESLFVNDVRVDDNIENNGLENMVDIDTDFTDGRNDHYLHSIPKRSNNNSISINEPQKNILDNNSLNEGYFLAPNNEIEGISVSKLENCNDVQMCDSLIKEDICEYENSYEDGESSFMSVQQDILNKDLNNNISCAVTEGKVTLIDMEELKNLETSGSISPFGNSVHKEMSSTERERIFLCRTNKGIVNSNDIFSDNFKESECEFMNRLLRSPNADLNTSKALPSNLDYLFDLNSPKADDSFGFDCIFDNPVFELDRHEKEVDSFCSEKFENVDFNSLSQSKKLGDIFTKSSSNENSNIAHTYKGLDKCDRENFVMDISSTQMEHSFSSSTTNTFTQKENLPEYFDISDSAISNKTQKIFNENGLEKDVKEFQNSLTTQDNNIFVDNSDNSEELLLNSYVNNFFADKVSYKDSLLKNEISTLSRPKAIANESKNKMNEVRLDENISSVDDSLANYNLSLQNHNSNDDDCSFENMFLNTKAMKLDEKDLASLDDVLVKKTENSLDISCQKTLSSLTGLNTRHEKASAIDIEKKSMFRNMFDNENNLAGSDLAFPLEENATPLVDYDMSSGINSSHIVSSERIRDLYDSPFEYTFSSSSSSHATTSDVVWTTQSPIPSYSSLFSPFQETNSFVEDCLKTQDINSSVDFYEKNKNKSMDNIEILLDEYLECFNDSLNEKSNNEIDNTNDVEKESIESVSRTFSENALNDLANGSDLKHLETEDKSKVAENLNIKDLLNYKSSERFIKSTKQNIFNRVESISNSAWKTPKSIKGTETMDNDNEEKDVHNKTSIGLSNIAKSGVKICKALNKTGSALDFVKQTLSLENNTDAKSKIVKDVDKKTVNKNVGVVIRRKDSIPEQFVLNKGWKDLRILPLNKTSNFRLISPKQPVYVMPNFANNFAESSKSVTNQHNNYKKRNISTSNVHQLQKQTENQFKKKSSLLRKFSVSTFLKTLKVDASADPKVSIQRLSKETLASDKVEKIVLSTGTFNVQNQNNHECFNKYSHQIICSSENKNKCHIRLAGKPIKCSLKGKVVENVKSCKLRALKFINGKDQRFQFQDGSGDWPEREEFYSDYSDFPVKNAVDNFENTILNPAPNPKLPLPQLSSFISQYVQKKNKPQLIARCAGILPSNQNTPDSVVYPVGKTGISISIPTGIGAQPNVMPCDIPLNTPTHSKQLNVDTGKILPNGKTTKFLFKLQKIRACNQSKNPSKHSKPIPNKQYFERVIHPLILPKIKDLSKPLQIIPSLNQQATVGIPFTLHNIPLNSSKVLDFDISKNVAIQPSSLTTPISICQVSLSQSIPTNSLCIMVPTNSVYSASNYKLEGNTNFTLGKITDDVTVLGQGKSRILSNPGILENLTPICSLDQKTEEKCSPSLSVKLFDCQEKNKQLPNNDCKTGNTINQMELSQNNKIEGEVDLASTSKIVQHLRRKILKRRPYPDSIKNKARKLLRDDLKSRFPGISDGILEKLAIPPQVLHRGYFSVRDVKIIQNQILSLQLNSMYKEHVIVCNIQNCQLCLKYEKQKKALLFAEKEQRLGTKLINKSRHNITKSRGRGKGRKRKVLEDPFGNTEKDPTYKSTIGPEKRKVIEHQYLDCLDKKNKFTENIRNHDEDEPIELTHKPECALQLLNQSRKRSSSESNVHVKIKVTCFGSCDDSCVKGQSCRICRSCLKDTIYTEKYKNSDKRKSLIDFIKNLLNKKGPSCAKKMEFFSEKNEFCINEYKNNLQLKAKIDKEFPPFSENDEAEPSQKGVPRNLPRPLYLDLHSLQIGSNILAADYTLQMVPKLRIIYSARKFVYELKLHDGGIDQNNNQELPMLLVIDVQFKTVRALSISSNKVLVCVDTVPWVGVLGRKRACRVVMPNPLMTKSQQKLFTLIKAALTIHPVHKLILPDHSKALAMYNGLIEVFPWFHRALKLPFPVSETVNTTWSLKSQIDIDHCVGLSSSKNNESDLMFKENLKMDNQRNHQRQVPEGFPPNSPTSLINCSDAKNLASIVYDSENNHLTKKKIEINKMNLKHRSENCSINPDPVKVCSVQVNMKKNSSLPCISLIPSSTASLALPTTSLLPSIVLSAENPNTTLIYSPSLRPSYGFEKFDDQSKLPNLYNDTLQNCNSKQIQSYNGIEGKYESSIHEGNVVKCSRYFGAIGKELDKLITKENKAITPIILSMAVKAVMSTQVHSSSVGINLPTLLPQSCTCTQGACRSMTCPCARAGALCHTGTRCGCKDCVNPLNVLSVLNIDVNTSRMDECLMQNLYNFDMLGLCEVLLKVLPVPCCGRKLDVCFLLPGTVLCVHCGAALSFSWCLNWPSLQAVSPRNHCLVCCSCQPPLHTHCQICGQCTRSTALGACTTCGSPKLFGL